MNPVAEKIRKNIYVDNVITGMKTPVEAYQFYVEARNIFQEASMNLWEWMSNSAEFLSMIPECDKAHGENVKVLGVRWNPKGDTYNYGTKYANTKCSRCKEKVIMSCRNDF